MVHDNEPCLVAEHILLLRASRVLEAQALAAFILRTGFFACLAACLFWPNSSRAAFAAQVQAVAPPTHHSAGDRRRPNSVVSKVKSEAAAKKLFAAAERLRKQAKAQAMLAAVEKYKASLPLWRAATERGAEAETLRLISEVYNFLGDNQQALEYGRNALSLYSSLNEQAGEARILHHLGEVYYSIGDMEQALAHHSQALDKWSSLGDKAGQAKAQMSIAYDRSVTGDIDEALDALSMALDLTRSANDRNGEALAMCAIATQYSMIGEGQKALALYDRALIFFRAVSDRYNEAVALNGLAYVYYQIGERQRALDLYRQTLSIYLMLGHRQGEAVTRILIGRIYDEVAKPQQAIEQFEKALNLNRKLSNRLMQSYALGYLGKAYDSLGDTPQALGNYRRALELNRLGPNRREEAYTLSNIGHVLFKRSDHNNALEHYTQALKLSRDVGDLRATALVLYYIARVERERGNLDAARSQVEEALKVSDAFRAKVAAHEMRASYAATVHQQYEFYIDVLMRLHNQRPSERFDAAAFEASERGRARSLIETLAENRKEIRQDVDAELLRRERELQQRLSAKAERRIQLASVKSQSQELAAVEKELGELTTEFQQVQGQIRAMSPRYAALVQPVPLTLGEIQEKVLDDNTILLEYSLGEERSFVWAVSSNSIKSFELPPRAEVEKASRRIYQLLTARNRQVKDETGPQWQAHVRQAEAEYADASAALGRMLLEPVAAELGRKRLVIVADGTLQYIPFAALPVPGRDAGAVAPHPQAGFGPLIVEHEVVSLPSASILALMREELHGRRPAPKSVAVLADPVFDNRDERLTAANRDRAGGRQGVARTRTRPGYMDEAVKSDVFTRSVTQRAIRGFDGLNQGAGIARLAFSQREAKSIMASLPAGDGMLALGFRANRATAMSPELAQYRIVHFATHGLLNSEHPELSGVVLSLFDEAGRRQNGFLQLHEIYNLNLPADLVVLSACQTALGREISGEGLVGLTRGFMYAGAARVVASLWKVDDAATADLMGEFYRKMLSDGLNPAAALRAAQLHMWRQNQWRSPFYWAAFTLQGEWR